MRNSPGIAARSSALNGRIEGSPSPNGSPPRYDAHAVGAAQRVGGVENAD
jgi:hypothetical protein